MISSSTRSSSSRPCAFGFRLGDVPVPVRYFPEASSIDFGRSVRYGVGTLATVAAFWLDRLAIRRSPLFAEKGSSQPWAT